MKDKILQIRVSEQELEDLKGFTDKIGFKNVSDTVRESLKVFVDIKEREPRYSENIVKANNASNMLWSARFLCNGFDIQEYFLNDEKEVPEEYKDTDFNSMLIAMHDDGYFNSLKKCVLECIFNDLAFFNNIDEDIESLIKKIAIEYVQKR